MVVCLGLAGVAEAVGRTVSGGTLREGSETDDSGELHAGRYRVRGDRVG